MEGKIAKLVKELMVELEIDIGNENFLETPQRVERMYREILYTKKQRDELVAKYLSKTFPSKYTGLIVSKGIETYGVCGHHILPIRLTVTMGYIPKGRVVGLSKLARVADVMAKQPMIQEDYTEEIVEQMMYVLKPEGVGVYVEGLHFCETMRGAKQHNATMITTSLAGCFIKDASIKQEFMEACRQKGG